MADFSKTVTTITADMVGPEAIPDKLLSNLPAAYRHGGFDAIVSALAFHHLTHNEKSEAYRRAFECLRPGGVFVNGDLFSYRSHELTLQAQEYDLAWIDRQFRSPPAELRDAQAIPEGRRDELRELWMEHYRSDNIVEPLESTERTEGQIDMLRSIGFADVGCPFRYQQLGILWAKK